MRNRELSGTVLLIAIFLFSHTGLSSGGEQLRRYLLDAPGSGHFDHCYHLCGHGTCVGHLGNNGEYYNCKCDQGWHGTHCTQEYAPSGTKQCYNTYCVHGDCWYSTDQFGHRWNHHCVCYPGWDGKHCDQQSPTMSSTTHTASSPSAPAMSSSTTAQTTTTQKTTKQTILPPASATSSHAPTSTPLSTTVSNLSISSAHGTIQCYNTYCVHGNCAYHTDQYGHRYNHHCVCQHGWDGKHCDQQLTTVPSTTHNVSSPSTPSMSSSIATETTTTEKTTTQMTLPPASAISSYAPTSTPLATTVTNPSISSAVPLSSCDHTSTLLATAFQTPVANQNAIECSPGSHTSHEAFVLTECSVPQNPSSWQQGVNVMADCGSSDAIPTYTPIAAFDRGFYSSVWSLSGIFLGCTNNSFKIALQTCGQAPHITELQLGGSNRQNPKMFYTIK